MHIGKSECDEAPARAASNNATGCTLTVDTGDNSVTCAVTVNDDYGNTDMDEKCDPENNPTAYVYEFAYTGNVQTFTAPYPGNYKLELWGASGGKPGATTQSTYGDRGEGSG